MLSRVMLQYRVSGGLNSSTNDSSGSNANVPIMYRLSGVVSALPSSAASALSSALGWVSSSGLTVRWSVASLTIVHAIAVNCSAASASVIGCNGSASTHSMSMVAGSSVSASPMYSRTTIDEASAGMGIHCAAPRMWAAGSAAESTSANAPELRLRSVSLT